MRLFSPVKNKRRLALSLLGTAALMLTSCGEIAPEQPNILIFVVSSLRADALGTYDLDRTETPHFDELAIDGVTFEEAYATSSWDRPALTSLLSGLYPWHHGVNAKEDSLDPSMPSIARAFSKDGYTSALITANPNVGPLFGLDEGFDETIELYSRSQPGRVEPHEFIAKAQTVVEVALKWMEERPRPYFLVVLAIDPRAPYLPSRSDDPGVFRARSGVDGRIASLKRLSRSRTPNDEARIRELYQAEVKATDEAFGELISTLRMRGELEETLVVLTADHGEAFWEYRDIQGHGKTVSEEVLRVPLVVRYPKDRRFPPGARTTKPVSLVDLGPTLLDLTGVSSPGTLDGRPFFDSAIQARPPILAALDTSQVTLLTSVRKPYKLLWDRDRGEVSLFDLRVTRPEAEPFDPRPDEKAGLAHEELFEALIESLRIRESDLSEGKAGELPQSIQSDLRALGRTP
ncbi:MAG: hypothetical protein CMN75_04410 [Spirochaeta sp.]|nr:hypothetical protein [Spirochaeta sp.]RPG07254.1 MAG: hypothetical protein CBC32_009885 [Proteobacteria bacterium TMED72]